MPHAVEMMKDLGFADMVADDIAEVLEIESVSFSNPWRDQDFHYALNRDGGVARICRVQDVVLGYAVGFRTGSEFHLADFAVRSECQRRGYGAALLQILIAETESTSEAITLEVRRSNQAAVRMYTRAGFQTVAIRQDYYSRPREDALVMVKALSGKLSEWVARALSRASGMGESH